jgi:hypothetical protein
MRLRRLLAGVRVRADNHWEGVVMMIDGDIARIEQGWRWLQRSVGRRDWDERYERWLRWIAVLDLERVPVTWSADVRSVMESFSSDHMMPPCDDLTAGLRFCPHCGDRIWFGWVMTLGQPARRPYDGPLLLNAHPTAVGRWIIVAPGEAEWCRGIDLRDWPLPRFTSHLMTCPVLIVQREQQRQEQAEKLIESKQIRAERRKAKWARVYDIVDRAGDDPA